MPGVELPTVGRIVHYVAYGTPGGEYPPEHRAAIVTEVMGTTGHIALAVLNPQGVFFNPSVTHSDEHIGGSWHWPERVDPTYME